MNVSAGFLEKRYARLKAAASTDELDGARDALIAFLERRLADSQREIDELRALYIERPAAKL
jgi:hypothetical protein